MTTSPIDPAKLREEVLSDGEGDYTGLYEIVWSLNTQYPRLDPDLKVAAARAVVADLLRDGRVSLYRPPGRLIVTILCAPGGARTSSRTLAPFERVARSLSAI